MADADTGRLLVDLVAADGVGRGGVASLIRDVRLPVLASAVSVPAGRLVLRLKLASAGMTRPEVASVAVQARFTCARDNPSIVVPDGWLGLAAVLAMADRLASDLHAGAENDA